jgi:hypothetical protein
LSALARPDSRWVCCIEQSEEILTGNLTGGTPSGCFPAVPTRSRRAGQGALDGVLTVNLLAKITCDRSMQQTRRGWPPVLHRRHISPVRRAGEVVAGQRDRHGDHRRSI